MIIYFNVVNYELMNHDSPKRSMYRQRTEFAISFSDKLTDTEW